MKKSLSFALLLSLGAFSQLSLAEQTLRFGVDPTFPPFESKASDGSLQGFDIELGNAICAQAKVTCQWVQIGFDSSIPALQARKFDAILSAMSMTEKRREQVDFSAMIYNNYAVRKAFAEQYPQIVSAFLRVHQQKVDEFRQHPEQAAATVAKEVGAPVTTATNTLSGLEYPSIQDQATAAWLGDGKNADASGIGQALSKTASFLAETGEVRKRDIPAHWNAAINPRFLQQAAHAAP